MNTIFYGISLIALDLGAVEDEIFRNRRERDLMEKERRKFKRRREVKWTDNFLTGSLYMYIHVEQFDYFILCQRWSTCICTSTCIIMYVHEHLFLFKIVYEIKNIPMHTATCKLHVEMFLIFETIIMPSINASQSLYTHLHV